MCFIKEKIRVQYGLDDIVLIKYDKIKYKKQQEYDKIKCGL